MAEIVSNICDLTYSSPVTLKEISAIAAVVGSWRTEICTLLKTESLEDFDLAYDITIESAIADASSSINGLLQEYISKFHSSIRGWLNYHSTKVFSPFHSARNYVLSNFQDFVTDWNGTIHYVRTAKRMMLCGGLANLEKFKIACLYCFEDDIKQIWPSVSYEFKFKKINYDTCPQLCYWICRLENALHKMHRPFDKSVRLSVDEMMLEKCDYNNHSFAEYFWNRVPLERQSQAAVKITSRCPKLFARFILPKLNKFQLEDFLAEKGANLISHLLIYGSPRKNHFLPAWAYIENKINESSFVCLIEKLLQVETDYFVANKEELNPKDNVYLCCEIWKNAPENFKRSTLSHVLQKDELFLKNNVRSSNSKPREVRFLLTVLLDASFQERSEFWLKTWRNLIYGARVEDLLEIMKLCFRNENEIISFKENAMATYENINEYCDELLQSYQYTELDNFLSFCCPDVQKKKQLKQRLLRSNYLGDKDYIFGPYLPDDEKSLDEFSEFIDDAFLSADSCTDFKNQFFSSRSNKYYLYECIESGRFVCLMGLVDIFVVEKEAKELLKKNLFDSFKFRLMDGSIQRMESDSLQKVLLWFFDDKIEALRFKRSLPVESIIRTMVRSELTERTAEDEEMGVSFEYYDKVDGLLKWYYDTSDSNEVYKYCPAFRIYSEVESEVERENYQELYGGIRFGDLNDDMF